MKANQTTKSNNEKMAVALFLFTCLAPTQGPYHTHY